MCERKCVLVVCLCTYVAVCATAYQRDSHACVLFCVFVCVRASKYV